MPVQNLRDLHWMIDYIQGLRSIMLRFRANKTVFIAGIEKAFLEVSLKPEHWDFVRFLQ